jgi:hypothetical protein
MRFISCQLGSILAGLMFSLMTCQSTAFAETRLFVPDFRIGAGFDTQLVMSNNSDRDASVDLWVFVDKGRLLGQAQLHMNAHATESRTLAEVFGRQSNESTGWLVAVSNSDGIQMSYNLLGERTEPRDAVIWPKREVVLDIPKSDTQAVRLANTSSLTNNVTVRHRDETGGFIGLQELAIGPFQQIQLARETLQNAARVDVLATSDVLATIVDTTVVRPRVSNASNAHDEGALSLVIDRNAPVGSYQVLLRFDPSVIHFSQEDILAGSAAGFTSKPLAFSIDNTSGELRIASFQVGNNPQGAVDVAHIRIRPAQAATLQFGLTVEEVTDLEGHSDLNSTPSVRLVRLN